MFPIDNDKLSRVRAAMVEQDVDTLLIRAPDNLVYLSNYWSMKGWDILVFPSEGEPTFVSVAPQAEDIARTCWYKDVRYFSGYDHDDPRPPFVRSLDLALSVIRERGLGRRVGVEASHAVQGADRMVGEPTGFTKVYFDTIEQAVGEMIDFSPSLYGLRMIKTDQEVERLRITNDLAAEAVNYVRENLQAGMWDAEVGGMFEAFIHTRGIGYRDQIDFARAFTLVWSGPSIKTFTATKATRVKEDEPTLLEIWVCADGYWNDLTKNACPGEMTPEYHRVLDLLLDIFHEVTTDHVGPGARFSEVDGFIRARIAEGGYPGQPSHFVCHGVGVAAHEPPWAHTKSVDAMAEGMVLAVEPGLYWEGGGGLRLEDNFLITASGCEQLCVAAPDDFRK
jgi:Xaa-Pro aminopeptidase